MTVLTDDELSELEDSSKRLAADKGLQVLHLRVRGTRSRPIIEIVLDGERDVLLDDCEAVSRELQTSLDSILGQDVNYRLDVTSPGTDEPLINDYQFTRNIGRQIELTLLDGTKLSGKLTVFFGQSLQIEPKGQKGKTASEQQISRDDIKKAKVIVGF